MSFDLIIRAFFSDGGLSAGLAKANAGLAQIGKSGPGARTGLRAVEQGARALAFEAAGLAGPMGRVFSGLLQIGGGSAAVVGAVAGIGAIAFAYNALTKESREAAEAEKKHREELIRSAQQRAQAALPASQRIGVETTDVRGMLDSLTTLRQERVALLTGRFSAGASTRAREGSTQTLEEFIRTDKTLQDIDEIRTDLSLSISQNRRASANAAKDEAASTERELEARRALRLEAIQFLQAQHAITIAAARGGLGFVAGPEGTEVVSAARRRAAFTAPTFGVGLGIDSGPTTFRSIRTTFPRFGAPDPPEMKRDWLKSGTIIAQGFFQAATAIRGGGAGGVFGAVGALAGAGAQVQGISKGLSGTLGTLGLVGSVVGGLFSLFDHSAERRQREQMAELTRIRQNTERRNEPLPSSFTFILNGKEISGAILQDVIYGYGRAARTNNLPALPPSGG